MNATRDVHLWRRAADHTYLLVRGHTMHEHKAQDQAQLEAFRQFSQGGAAGGQADEISKLAELRDRGVLSGEEFDRAKAKVLG